MCLTIISLQILDGNIVANALGYHRSLNCTVFQCQYTCSVSKKNPPPCGFLNFFRKWLEFLIDFFTQLLCDHFYTRIQIFIQISPTVTKLCHTKRDHLPKFYVSLEL